MTDKAKEKSTTAKAEAKPAAKKPAAKKPAAKKPAAKKPADKSAADNQAKASTEPGQKANAARTEASEAPKAADKASEEFAGENRIKIERMNDGNQADVDVMINGRKESSRLHSLASAKFSLKSPRRRAFRMKSRKIFQPPRASASQDRTDAVIQWQLS